MPEIELLSVVSWHPTLAARAAPRVDHLTAFIVLTIFSATC